MPKLYKIIPEELKGRGIFQRFGGEVLFSPFGGNTRVVNADWVCDNCGFEWFSTQIKEEFEFHCPRCKSWVGVI